MVLIGVLKSKSNLKMSVSGGVLEGNAALRGRLNFRQQADMAESLRRVI